MFETLIGGIAAFCTTISYLPQVIKAWRTRETADLSLKMLLLLGSGLCLWVLYGFVRGDWLIVIANSLSVSMLLNLIYLKAVEKKSGA